MSAGAPMEVEVKLRLKDEAAHDKVLRALADSQRALHKQENFFFDGSKRELSTERNILRVRFYNGTEKALVTIKGKMKVEDGVGRALEDEEAVDPKAAREFLTDPSKLLALDIGVINRLKARINVTELVCLGGFRNVRKEVDWEGVVLEVDETQYEWGTTYEIECETSEPEAVREKLEAFLTKNSIAYAWNTTTKFQNFINRTLM